MSVDIITEKLLQSLKDELDKDKYKVFIENEFLTPIIHKILDQLYPYILWTGLLFMSMFVFIMIILCLNVRVFMYHP
jgi:protoheme ferro-lyase